MAVGFVGHFPAGDGKAAALTAKADLNIRLPEPNVIPIRSHRWGAVPEQRIREFEAGELDKSPEWGADFRTRTKSFKIMCCIPGVPRAMDRPFCVLRRVA